MGDVDINALEEQFTGRKFGELVLHHMKKQPFDQIILAVHGTSEQLPPSIQAEVEALIDHINPLVHDHDFWAEDCGRILKFITSTIQTELQRKRISPSEDDLFNLFNIIVLNFAYGAHKSPKMKQFISTAVRKTFWRRIFG